MPAIFQNFMSGTITDNPLLIGATSVSASNFANLQVVAAPDTMWLVLDPDGVNGAPEIVQVTAHTAAALSCTIVRGQQGTTARQHPVNTVWRVAVTKSDLDQLPYRVLTTTGDLIYASAANTAARLAAVATGNVLKSGGVGTAPSWGQVTSADITDGTIVNGDISASAAIAYSKLNLALSIVNGDISASAAIAHSKLANTTAGFVLLGNGSGVVTATALSGDVTVSPTGTTTISNLAVDNARISNTANIAVSKLLQGTAGQVLLNNATPTPTWTTVSGDVTIGATGVTAIGAGKVTNSMISTAGGDLAGVWTTTSGLTTTNVSTPTVSGEHMQIGKTLFFQFRITAGTVTAAGAITINTPFTSIGQIQSVGATITAAGLMQAPGGARWEISTNTIRIWKSDGTNFAAADSAVCRVSGVIQLA